MPVKISPELPAVDVGAEIHLRLQGDLDGTPPTRVEWTVEHAEGGRAVGELTDMPAPTEKVWRAVRVDPGEYIIRAKATANRKNEEVTERIVVHATPLRVAAARDRPAGARRPPAGGHQAYAGHGAVGPYPARYRSALVPALRRLDGIPVLRSRAAALAFSGRYREAGEVKEEFERGHRAAPLPFPDMEGYKVLVAATQAFLEFNCEVVYDLPAFSLGEQTSQELGLEPGDNLRALWRKYVEHTGGMLPYLDRVRMNLGDVAADAQPPGGRALRQDP